jgi:hypothetical protein
MFTDVCHPKNIGIINIYMHANQFFFKILRPRIPYGGGGEEFLFFFYFYKYCSAHGLLNEKHKKMIG